MQREQELVGGSDSRRRITKKKVMCSKWDLGEDNAVRAQSQSPHWTENEDRESRQQHIELGSNLISGRTRHDGL